MNFILGAGDNYRHHCNGTQRKAQIMFICDPSAGQVCGELTYSNTYQFYLLNYFFSLLVLFRRIVVKIVYLLEYLFNFHHYFNKLSLCVITVNLFFTHSTELHRSHG